MAETSNRIPGAFKRRWPIALAAVLVGISPPPGRAQDLGACQCDDIPMIQYRMEEAARARDDFKARSQTVNPNEIMDIPIWDAITAEVKNDLHTMKHTYQESPGNGGSAKTHPVVCTTTFANSTQCMEQILDAHESVHRQACRDIPNLGWMNTETVQNMEEEEARAYQAEYDAMAKLLEELSCKCRRFGLVLNHSTSVSVLGGGARTDLHRKLMSGGDSGLIALGALIPLFVSDEGVVEGSAYGDEVGWANLLAPRMATSGSVIVDARLTIDAHGTISPANGCTAVGCRSDDMLHVTIYGSQGDNSGESHVQVGGRKFDRALTGGGGNGQIEFDLPAYVGEYAEQTILVPGTSVQAIVSVKIVSLKHFEPALTDGQGTSLLFAAKECKKKP
jgi:hypothetical protein